MKSSLILRLLFLSCLMLTTGIWAEEARPLAENAAVEAQLRRLSEELRCLVCQNQTLADSSAPLAEDLRQEIREMSAQGMNDQAIIDYLVVRYGDFVRYRPPFKRTTALLWLGPFVLLLTGGAFVFMVLRRRQKMKTDAPLTAEEASKVAKLLDKES